MYFLKISLIRETRKQWQKRGRNVPVSRGVQWIL